MSRSHVLLATVAGAAGGLLAIHPTAYLAMSWGSGKPPWMVIEHAYAVQELGLLGYHVLIGAMLGAAIAAILGRAQARALASQRHALELETQLVKAQRLESLGLLAAGVAHEINNPVAFIKSNEQLNLQLLAGLRQDGGLPDAARATLADVEESIRVNLGGVERVQAIVAGLRQLTRPTVDRQPVDLNAVVRDTLTLAVPRTRAVDIEADLAAGEAVVRGNRHELAQVVLNLVLNAVEAVPAGGGRVAVRTRATHGGVEVEVANNGPAIPPEVMRNLWTPFYTTKAEGTGLGLAICRRIVRNHGGSITVASRPDDTRFTVQLPAGALAPAPTPEPPIPRA